MRTNLTRLRIQFETADAAINHTFLKGAQKPYDQWERFHEKAEAFARWEELVRAIVTGDPATIARVVKGEDELKRLLRELAANDPGAVKRLVAEVVK